MKAVKEVLVGAKRDTDAGRTDFDEADRQINQQMEEVNSGAISGAVAKELMSCFETVKPMMSKGREFLNGADELIQKANKEYDATAEETTAVLNSHRL